MDPEFIPIPFDTKTFLEWLEEAYPPKCIALGETPEQAHRYAGQQQLVAEARAWFEETIRGDKGN